MAGESVRSEAITRIATGFMASKQLFAACKAGIFIHLADGPLALDELAARCGLPARTVRVLADAMTALGLLDCDMNRYVNRPETQSCLSGARHKGLQPLLHYWDEVSYPTWLGLDEAVRTNRRGGPADLPPERQQEFARGMQALAAGAAEALAGGFGIADHRRVLDVGGGIGRYLTAVLAQYPHLTGTLFDLPSVLAAAQPELTASLVGDRVQAVPGNPLSDPVPAGHDLVLMAHVAHCFTPEMNRSLLTRVRGAVEPGARILLVGFWTDSTHTQPLLAALLAGEFLTSVGGDVYSVEEVEEWLVESGWQPEGQQPLHGALTVLAAQAI